MKKLQKIKLQELVDESTKINVDEMQKIVGGAEVTLFNGCDTGICSNKINTIYCEGGAVCTSGIG